MESPSRVTPFVTVSWLAPFLVGDRQCLAALPTMSQYVYSKVSSSFDHPQWRLDHAAMVQAAAQSARAHGYQVRIENQNVYRLVRDGITIVGRPDVVSFKGMYARVEDCKSGRHKLATHYAQVMLYMMLVSEAFPQFRDLAVGGVLHYRDESVPISPAAVDSEFAARTWELVHLAVEKERTVWVPSARE